MIAVGVGTGVGVNALLSRSIGAKDEEMTEKAASTGVVLSLLSSLAFILFGLLFTNLFVRAFTQDAQIALYSKQYIFICTVFSVGSFVATMYQRFLQATGDTVDSMISLIAGAVTNIVLDPIFIFGLLGCPRMEVLGAAVATVIGQWVSAAVAITLNMKKNPVVKVNLKGFRFDQKVVGQIYRVGLPTIVTQAVGSVMVSAINGILMPISTSAVAFFGAYYRLQNFLFMPMNGLGQALIPIVGYSYGAKKFGRIREAIRTALPIAVAIALAATVVFLILPKQLLGLFSPTDEMLAIGIPALRIISVTFAFTAVTMTLGYAMSGLGNGMVNMVGTVIRQLLLFVPLAYLFAHLWGIGPVWYAMWVSETAAFLYSILTSRRALKKMNVIE
jgi:putative MATE family efflux protein